MESSDKQECGIEALEGDEEGVAALFRRCLALHEMILMTCWLGCQARKVEREKRFPQEC